VSLDRPNLTVLVHALVTRITFEDKRATGVECIYNGKPNRISAGLEVVLSLGAIHTPKVLMQSRLHPLKRDPGATSKAFCGERSLRRDVSHFPAIRRWEIAIAQIEPFLLIFGLTVRFYAFESASESARKFSLDSRWFLLMGASTRNR